MFCIHIRVEKLGSKTVIERGALLVFLSGVCVSRSGWLMDTQDLGICEIALFSSLPGFLPSFLPSSPLTFSLLPSPSPALTLSFYFSMEILKQLRLVFPHHLELVPFIFDSANFLQS